MAASSAAGFGGLGLGAVGLAQRRQRRRPMQDGGELDAAGTLDLRPDGLQHGAAAIGVGGDQDPLAPLEAEHVADQLPRHGLPIELMGRRQALMGDRKRIGLSHAQPPAPRPNSEKICGPGRIVAQEPRLAQPIEVAAGSPAIRPWNLESRRPLATQKSLQGPIARLPRPGLRRGGQSWKTTERPPSTTMHSALMKGASSEARKTAVQATSSGRPMRLGGCRS